MIRREFVRINVNNAKGRRTWHATSNDGNYLLCREQVHIGELMDRKVLAVTFRQEHKPPHPMCKTCRVRITPEYTRQWVEKIRTYQIHRADT